MDLAADRLADDEFQHKMLSLLFIKPENQDTFRELLLEHNSKHFSNDSTWLCASFMRSHGQRLWPKRKSDRVHLNQAPTDDEVMHWARKPGRRPHVEGPIFDDHGHLKPEEKHNWRFQHGGRPFNCHESLSCSKLGRVLELYVADIISGAPTYTVEQSDVREEDLIQRILSAEEGTLSPKHHSSRRSTKGKRALRAKEKKGSLQGSEPSAEGSSNRVAVTRRKRNKTDVISQEDQGTTQRQIAQGNTAGPVPSATAFPLSFEDSAVTSARQIRDLAHNDVPIASWQSVPGSSEGTMVEGARQTADYGRGNSISLTNSAIVNKSAKQRQTRSNEGEEADNAAEAIRKIRTFAFKEVSMAAASGQGKKRSMPATEPSTVPPKKQRKRKRNASPQRGTFVIPPGLHRMEALPLRKRRPRKQVDASQPGVFRQTDAPASLTDDSQFHPEFRIIELPFNYMEIVPNMPPPDVDEEERRKTLATYMQETGSMGGLPIVQ
ncbi:hypothetical protein PRZ48_009514 [Zasmidium cellare]|uniref:Uncharacterized protein n=1 Tax=Zasmidium cellare TaxID=395010 RepID=A0ABR0EBZ5_ZASCE|nr:hypothetical protein PRZ48_009514 [Zasmidium cellare]